MALRDRIESFHLRPLRAGVAVSRRGAGRRRTAGAVIAAGAFAAAAPAQVALEDYVARSLARTALLDLRMQPEVDSADYEIAALLFAEAGRWSPDDEILLRREIDARWASGDEATALDLTRKLLRLDLRDGTLDDEVSMLRVLSADISRLQTVEERLQRYESLLQRTDLPAPIRARLALDAALLLREQGDVGGFATMLARSTALDSTYKEAAALAATYYASHSSDPVGRLEALLNVLLADPLDLNVHLSLSRALSSQGAYEPALAFHRAALGLASVGGQEAPENLRLELLVLRWMVWGPAGLAGELEQPLVEQRGMVAQTVIRRQRAGQPIDDLPRPEQILPSLAAARLRTMLAAAEGDQSATTRAMRDLAGAIDAELRRLAEQTADPGERAQIALYIRQLAIELQAMRLITGAQLELASEDLLRLDDEFNGSELPEWLTLARPEEVEMIRNLLRAVLGLHRVQQGEVDALEDAWAGRDLGQLGRILLAEAYAELGLADEAAASYSGVLQRQRLSMWSAWARHRLLAIAPQLAAPPRVAVELTEVAQQVPRWVWRSASDPTRFMSLLLRAGEMVEDPLGGGVVWLRIRNDAPAPIAMGPDQPINTRFLLAPKLEIGPRNAGALAVPEVVNADRRLRLNPREAIEIELWPAGGVAGWFLETSATSTSRVRWRALQGFTINSAGAYVPGPMCLSAETELIRRDLVEETQLSGRELATRLASDGEHALAVTCLAIRSLYVGPDARQLPEEFTGALVQIAAERYPTLSPAGRMAMALGLPNAAMNPAMAPFDEAAQRETDPRVLAAVLLTRVTDAASPALARARESDDAAIQRLAALIESRLGEDGPSFARFRSLPRGVPLGGASSGGGGR